MLVDVYYFARRENIWKNVFLQHHSSIMNFQWDPTKFYILLLEIKILLNITTDTEQTQILCSRKGYTLEVEYFATVLPTKS